MHVVMDQAYFILASNSNLHGMRVLLSGQRETNEQSGESRGGFCERRGLGIATLDYWRCRVAAAGTGRLVEVEVKSPCEEPSQGVLRIGMTPTLLKQHVPLTDETRGLLESSMDQMNFSARAHHRILKVARAIADLAGSADVTADHLLEAVNFRTLDRNYWV